VHQAPERARERILDLAATQLENGGAYHQYQPLTKRGNDAVGGGFNDDPLWLPLAVAAYIKETGDWSILDAPVTYESKPGTEQPLAEHLERAMQYTLDRLGSHGLPLIGRADWNDCLNLNIFSDEPGESFQTAPLKKDGTVAESVFIGVLFVLAAKEMAQMQESRIENQESRIKAGEPESQFAIRNSHSIWMQPQRWRRPSGRMVGMGHGSGGPMMRSGIQSVRRNVKKGKSSLSRRGWR